VRFPVLLVLPLLASCGPRDGGSPEPGWEGLAAPGGEVPRTVVLVSLDTLRADHLSLYGYARPTSPQLEDLARRATVYTQARSTAPWTLPAHASLFTGLYPFQHGANFVAGTLGQRATSLAPEAETLAEVLRGRGYRTGAVVANAGFLDPVYRLDQGFDTYDVERDVAGGIVARALGWLDAQGDAPVFLFLNFMDTHRPYNCAPRAGFTDYGTGRDSGKRLKRLRRALMRGDSELPADTLAELVEQYDTAIANLDEGLGTLFDGLRARGRFERALIVVTSDHGEFLGEHALIEHAKDVYEPVLRVPLIVRPPGGITGTVDGRPISLAHVPGLILSYVLDGPRELASSHFAAWPRGGVLAEQIDSNPADMQDAWLERLQRVRRAYYREGVKVIESSDGEHELYDLTVDPGELHDLVAEEPERAAALRAELAALLASESPARLGAGGLIDLTSDEATLRELGYLGDDGPAEGDDRK